MAEPKSEELILHLVVLGDDADGRSGYSFLGSIWAACRRHIGMTEPVPHAPVGIALPESAPHGIPRLVAASRRDSPGLYQAALWQANAAVCMSVVLSPADSNVHWSVLDEQWRTICPAPSGPSPAIDVLRVFQAVVANDGTGDGALQAGHGRPSDAVGQTVDRLPPRLRGRPISPAATVLTGGARIWRVGTRNEDRREEDLLALSPPAGADALSAWTWSAGGWSPPPIVLHAVASARLRRQTRAWADDAPVRRTRQELSTHTRALRGALREMRGPATPSAGTGTGIDLRAHREQGREQGTERLDAVLDACRDLDESVAEAADSIAGLRSAARTVRIEAANLSALTRAVPPLVEPGPLADDLAPAVWSAGQLDDDAGYLEAAREAAVGVLAIVRTEAMRELSRYQEDGDLRRERFALLQTAVVGAVVMMLAAVQSLQYAAPVPASVKPAVVCLLGAFALWPSAVVAGMVGRGGSGRGVTRVAVRATAGLVAAAAAWVTVAGAAVGNGGKGWSSLATLGVCAAAFVAVIAFPPVLARARTRVSRRRVSP